LWQVLPGISSREVYPAFLGVRLFLSRVLVQGAYSIVRHKLGKSSPRSSLGITFRVLVVFFLFFLFFLVFLFFILLLFCHFTPLPNGNRAPGLAVHAQRFIGSANSSLISTRRSRRNAEADFSSA